MEMLGLAGVAAWFTGVSIVATGVFLGGVGLWLLKEVCEQLEWSWIQTKNWFQGK